MPLMTGKRALMDQLVADGVRHVFGNPGTTEQGFMDILQDYPEIEFMLALHEGVAVSMADAYARLTRRPAFVEVHIASGLGNALGMLYNARDGHSPLVVYAGQSDTRALFQQPDLTGPLVEMARPICKWAAQIDHTQDVPQALRRAFKIADEPPQGPVFLALPMDVLDGEADVDIVRTSYTRWRARPDAAAVVEIADLLIRAKQPMMLLGDGVALADAQAEAVAVADLLGAPILQAFTSEFTAPASHPLNAGIVSAIDARQMRAALLGCDVLLAVGTPVFRFLFPDPRATVMPREAKLVQIDLDAWELGKNVVPDVAMIADPKAALTELASLLQGGQTPEQRADATHRREAVGEANRSARKRAQRRAQVNWGAVPISVPRLMHEIRQALPPQGLIFAEAGSNTGELEAALQIDEPGRLFHVRGGGIGSGLPAALGAQLAQPNRNVLGLCSDGAAMYSLTALWTAAHHRIPVTYVMLNNGGYRTLKLNMLAYLGQAARERRFVAMDLTDPDLRFDRIAEGFGVPAWRVEHPEEVASALRQAISCDGPALLDVVIESSTTDPS